MKTSFQIALCLLISICCAQLLASDKKDLLSENKILPRFTLSDGREKVTFPDDFKGKPFAVYFGNVASNRDGYEFLSWGGGAFFLLGSFHG